MVMLSAAARERIEGTTSTSFAATSRSGCRSWKPTRAAPTPTTPPRPTIGLVTLRNVMRETEAYGFDKVKAEQVELGAGVRARCSRRARLPERGRRGLPGPGRGGELHHRRRHQDRRQVRRRRPAGCRRAPLACDERPDYKSFRVGRSGSTSHNVARTVATLEKALDQVG